jgi:hypothetical protein
MRPVLALSLALVVAACGDKLGTGTFPQIDVSVDNQTFSGEGGTAFFGQALQQVVSKSVTVSNGGTANLRITSIDWDVDATTGARLKNQYVEIDFRNAVGADAFPYIVDPSNLNELTFAVEYTPPLGKPLDDFSESVLVIKSNARGEDGRSSNEEVRIVFSMTQDVSLPRVTPISYRFQNATQAKPESQEFRIYNDDALATAPFRVMSVRLENPSDEFTLQGIPSVGTVVLEPGNPAYQDVVFSCTYQPKDDSPDTNAIIIETDVGVSGLMRIPLTTGTNRGSYSLSYSHVNEFDFSNVTSKETRSVQITSEGPGPITVKEPRIEPAEARGDYSFKAFVPATAAGQSDTEVTSWPRGLNVGRALRIEVTYEPANDGSDTANGQLIVPFDNPDPGQISIDLFSGKPKSKIAVAPATGNVSVTGSIVASASGSREVIVYNEGNGPLNVEGVAVKADFDLPAKVWMLSAPSAAFSLAPGELRAIEVAYDLGEISNANGRATEYLEISYFNDFTGQSEKKTIGLIGEDNQGKTNPVADPGDASDYASAVVGEALTLSGAGSTASAGTIDVNAYVWYLASKPAGSMARLNEQGKVSATFIADVAGAYTFALVVYARDGSLYLFSEPATVTVNVAAAP